MPDIGRHYRGNERIHVQSLLFPRQLWNVQRAYQYVRRHRFFANAPPDITEHYIRVRQFDPDYDHFNYYTRSSDNGLVKAIVGIRKN